MFHMGGETASDATFKLHGQSSWAQTVMLDGDRAKMQFDISFHQSDPSGKFHGVEKLVFDMPRSDWTFMHDRLAHAWFRQVGIAAGCAANARVEINGSYYGLFVAEENTNKRVLAEFFPDSPAAVCGRRASSPRRTRCPTASRQTAFMHAADIATVSAIVDLDPRSGVGGRGADQQRRRLLRRQPQLLHLRPGREGVRLPAQRHRLDFDWMGTFDQTPSNDHPIYWWERRAPPQPSAGAIWLAAMNDPATRAKYVDAIAAQLAKWNVAADAGMDRHLVAADRRRRRRRSAHAGDAGPVPGRGRRRPATSSRSGRSSCRASSTATKNGTGADQDGDGVRWCEDCRDDNAAVHPGAAEICGNGIDDNCNGVVDDGC